MGEFDYQKRIVQQKNRDVLADFNAMLNSVLKAAIQAGELKNYASSEKEFLEAHSLNEGEFAKLHRLALVFMYLAHPEDDAIRALFVKNMPLFEVDGLMEQKKSEEIVKK